MNSSCFTVGKTPDLNWKSIRYILLTNNKDSPTYQKFVFRNRVESLKPSLRPKLNRPNTKSANCDPTTTDY